MRATSSPEIKRSFSLAASSARNISVTAADIDASCAPLVIFRNPTTANERRDNSSGWAFVDFRTATTATAATPNDATQTAAIQRFRGIDFLAVSGLAATSAPVVDSGWSA